MDYMCDQINTWINWRLALIGNGKEKTLGRGDWCVDFVADRAADMHWTVNRHLIDITPLCSQGLGLNFLSGWTGIIIHSCVGAAVSTGAAATDVKVRGFRFWRVFKRAMAFDVCF